MESVVELLPTFQVLGKLAAIILVGKRKCNGSDVFIDLIFVYRIQRFVGCIKIVIENRINEILNRIGIVLLFKARPASFEY